MRSVKKTIIITGATSGVGLALCRHFASKGWRVIGLGRRVDAQKVRGVEFIKANASTLEFYTKIRAYTLRADVLVNCAGIFSRDEIGNVSALDINRLIDTNIKGTIYATMACLKFMKKGNRIINISSISATHGIQNQSIYSATKAGINGFFESLQHELLPHGILLSTINPGGIDTPLWDRHKYKGNRKKLLKTSDIVSLVDYISGLPPHVVLKTVTLYPTNEIH